jgi:predicted nucleic acid-binding protein
VSVVIDTSAWIERLTGSATGQALIDHWPNMTDIIVPTLVQLELAKWLKRAVPEHVMDQTLAYIQTCRIAQLDTRTAFRAAELCLQHKLSTADAIVYAAALEADAALLTCDAHFKALPKVIYLPKQPAAPS